MQPMLDPDTVPVHPGRALLELCQQQGKQLRFAVASTLPDELLLAAQTLGLPEGQAPSAELVALAAEAATKASVGSPAAEAGTWAAAGAAGSAEKAAPTTPLAAGGYGAQGATNGMWGCVLQMLCLQGLRAVPGGWCAASVGSAMTCPLVWSAESPLCGTCLRRTDADDHSQFPPDTFYSGFECNSFKPNTSGPAVSADSKHAAIAGMAGDEEAEKALLPKPVLTPLQQHFQQEGTAYMVALVDEKPASRWAL